MRNMGCPEQTANMIYPVKPVIHEIFKDQQYEPVYPRIFDGFSEAMVIKKRKYNADINSPEQKVNSGIHKHHVDILYRIFPGVAFLFAEMT